MPKNPFSLKKKEFFREKEIKIEPNLHGRFLGRVDIGHHDGCLDHFQKWHHTLHVIIEFVVPYSLGKKEKTNTIINNITNDIWIIKKKGKNIINLSLSPFFGNINEDKRIIIYYLSPLSQLTQSIHFSKRDHPSSPILSIASSYLGWRSI